MTLVISPKSKALSRIAVFQGLTPQELHRVERELFPMTAKHKTYLLRAGEISDWVYFIIEGTVCILRPQKTGTSIILNMVGAGETLGEVCAIDNRGHSASALATEDTVLYKMRRSEFATLQESLSSLSKNVKYLLARRLRFATTHNESLAERKVHLRVSRLLMALANRYSTEEGQKTVFIPLRLTQKEIAQWARVSRQRAENHLKQLCECGALEITTGRQYRLIVLDSHQLRLHCD